MKLWSRPSGFRAPERSRQTRSTKRGDVDPPPERARSAARKAAGPVVGALSVAVLGWAFTADHVAAGVNALAGVVSPSNETLCPTAPHADGPVVTLPQADRLVRGYACNYAAKNVAGLDALMTRDIERRGLRDRTDRTRGTAALDDYRADFRDPEKFSYEVAPYRLFAPPGVGATQIAGVYVTRIVQRPNTCGPIIFTVKREDDVFRIAMVVRGLSDHPPTVEGRCQYDVGTTVRRGPLRQWLHTQLVGSANT